MESTSGAYVLSAGRGELLDCWKDRIRSKFLEVGSPSTNNCIIVSNCLIGVMKGMGGIERIDYHLLDIIILIIFDL